MVDEEGGSNINTAMGAAEEDIQSAATKEVEEKSCAATACCHAVYLFGDSHARDQADHLNRALNEKLNVFSTCCPGWPLNEVVEKAIARIDEFKRLTLRDFIVFIGGSNDTSARHQRILRDLYKVLFTSLANTNIIVCETPFRFDEVEKNTEIAETNQMVAELCGVFPNATFLPMINSMQRYHFTNHGLHMKQSGKRILSGLIAKCISDRMCQIYLSSVTIDDQ